MVVGALQVTFPNTARRATTKTVADGRLCRSRLLSASVTVGKCEYALSSNSDYMLLLLMAIYAQPVLPFLYI